MNNSTDAPSPAPVQVVLKHNWNIFLFALLIVSIGQLSLGLIFPLLPWIKLSFNSNQSLSETVIVSYLLGAGFSQLCYAPLSFIFGRRRVLILGLSISIIGLVIIIICSDYLYLLLLGRLIQGIGSGCESVIARLIIHDSYKSKYLLSAMTGLSIFSAFIPIFSPIIGGMVNHHLGWLAVFICILIYTLFGYILLILKLPETWNNYKNNISIKFLYHYYLSLLRDRYFMSYAIISWINWALVIFAFSSSPFVLESELKITSEHYSYWTIIPAVSFLLASWLCFRLRCTFGTHHIVFIAPIIQVVIGVILLVFPLNFTYITLGFIGLATAQALVYPCSQSLLLVPYSNEMGTVSALSGAGQMLMASMFIFLYWGVNITNFEYLSLVTIITSIVGFTFAIVGKYSIASADLEHK